MTTEHCAIATPHALATEAGAAAFRDGGNAVDAALAAAAVLAVAYPHMCSIGGDVIALVGRPDAEVVAVNGSGAAAAACSPDALRERDPEMPLLGPDTVTVPGAVRAWETLSGLAGRLPLGVVLAPAIEHASEGVPVAGSLAYALRETAHELTDPGMVSVFTVHGAPLGEGDVLRQPSLAHSLEAIATEGAAALYGGEPGRRLVGGLRALGSPLTVEDLEAHETELGEPLSGAYRDVEVVTAPPNSQGFVLLETLEALSGVETIPEPLGPDAPLLAEICRLASRDRDRHLADPRFAEVPVETLTDARHGADLLRRARSGLDVGGPSLPTIPPPRGDTVAVVTADDEGNAVSLIQSIFHTFGAGILEPETGIVCHNRGAFFSLDPTSPNVLAPRKRPAHTLMPVMVRRGGALIGVQGVMGGRAQPQIHLQLLLRRLRSELPDAALRAPRWVVGGLEAGQPSDVVRVEASAGEAAIRMLRATGMGVEVLADRDEEVGHGQLVGRDPDGAFVAGSDPRADGTAVIAARASSSGD